MIEISDLQKFIEKEREVIEEEIQKKDILSIRSLEATGHAIRDLTFIRQKDGLFELHCTQNISRFRPGDRLTLINSEKRSFKAVLFDIKGHGRNLFFKCSSFPGGNDSGKYIALEDTADFTFITLRALEKLKPGAPGWKFAERLSEDRNDQEIIPDISKKNLISELMRDTGVELDSSQITAFLKCMTLPSVYGIQGPPGTGKTLLLAFVAEALIRLGKRAVILAPTHQAVNNALTILHHLFPKRNIKKFGDELRNESLEIDIPFIAKARNLIDEPPDTVIGMTFMSAIQHIMISDQKIIAPNVVIVDEAGQLPLVQGIATGLSGAGSILLFGDDKQMPPVFEGDLAEDPLAVSVFSQLRKSQSRMIDRLGVTYRLNEELCDAIYHCFYNENTYPPLESGRKAKPRLFLLKYSEKAADKVIAQLLSPSRSLIWYEVPARNKFQMNSEEAEIASDLVATCINNGMTAGNIAVVTPFRRQVMLIRSLTRSKLLVDCELPIIDTVERVQGITVEIVIMSLCASNTEYIESIAEFLFSPNRFNVAVSRARTKSVILSSPDIFKVLPKTYDGIRYKKTISDLKEYISGLPGKSRKTSNGY